METMNFDVVDLGGGVAGARDARPRCVGVARRAEVGASWRGGERVARREARARPGGVLNPGKLGRDPERSP